MRIDSSSAWPCGLRRPTRSPTSDEHQSAASWTSYMRLNFLKFKLLTGLHISQIENMWWFGPEQATSHYLKQSWASFVDWHMASLCHNNLIIVCCPFVCFRGNHDKTIPSWGSSVDSPHIGVVIRSFRHFDATLNKLLNKHWNYRWLLSPWRSCDITLINND